VPRLPSIFHVLLFGSLVCSACGDKANDDDDDDDDGGFPSDDSGDDGGDDGGGGAGVDQDGDGFSAEEGDCDDDDATIYPGATETWYDGVDSDCGGDSDYDQDGDGHDAFEHGGTDCNDTDPSSGDNSNDADCDGAETTYDCDDGDPVVGVPRAALAFSGSDLATVPYNYLFDFDDGDRFTIAWWAEYTSGSEATLIKGDNETHEYGIQGGASRIAMVEQAIGVLASAEEAHPLEVWAQHAVVYDAGTISFYLDGEPNGSGSGTFGDARGSDLTLGNHPDGTDGLDGTLAELVIWSEARSAEEIADYAAGSTTAAALGGLVAHWAMDEGSGPTASDSSGNGLDAEISGAEWVEVCFD
jgi:hypothetical protein